MTENLLIKNGIAYDKEYSFKNCKNKRKLPFDFYLPNINSCVEVDGEQHFKPVRFGNISVEDAIINFKKQKNRDKIKNTFCLKNNIKLLRLSYLDFTNDAYINILNNFINN